MLNDYEIRKAVEDDWIGIEPYDETLLQPVSYDVTLADSYRLLRSDIHTIDTGDDGSYDGIQHYGKVPSWHSHTTGHTLSKSGLNLRHGDFILASTRERITLSSSMAARVEGKSSLGRLGVLVHSTAGFIDPGFEGQITLEVANLSHAKVMLYPGMPIGQIVFEPVNPPERDYSKTGHYQGQTGPTESCYRFRR
jgi:dCTP deaminase